jgi:hypothetical protein
MFRTMQNIGFLNRVRQTAAFCQLLAMSAWHLTHLNQSGSPNEYLWLSLSATQELQKQVIDPVQCGSDNAIGAVLVFVCCAVRKRLVPGSLVELKLPDRIWSMIMQL